MTAGAFKPAIPIASNSFNGYIDNGGGSTPTLHVTSLPSTTTATFNGTLGNAFTGNIPVGNTLNLTAISTADGAYPAVAIGTTILGTGVPANTVITGLVGTANGTVGSYTLNNTISSAIGSEAMIGTGILPGPADALMQNALTAGTITAPMVVSDGGVNITGSPILITSSGSAVNGTPVWNINQTYYPPTVNYTNLVGTNTTLIPGQYIQGATSAAGLTTPVSIVGYGTGTGGVGTYLLSNGSANGVGSAGSPAALISTGIGDAGAVAPGPALTIKDLGAGVAFPVTNFTAGTGAITVSGTFDTSVLGGAPTTIQAQVSLTAGGPPVPSCSACAWTNLSGYSATQVGSTTVWNWSGQALNIPAAAGPLFVSVRAANGTAYATMPSLIKVGLVFDHQGEGQDAAMMAPQSGSANSYFTGLWGLNQWFGLDQGPPVVGNYLPAQTIMMAGDRFGVLGAGLPFSEGISVYEQLLTNAFGWPVTVINTARDGIGITPETMGGVIQTQTVGLGDGSTTTWCSASKFCPTAGASRLDRYSSTRRRQTGANVTATIDNGSGAAGNILTTSAINLGQLEPGMSVTGAGITGSPTLVGCTSGCIPTGVPLVYPAVQKWTISVSQSAPIASESIRLDPPGGAPWPAYNIQSISLSFVNGGFGTQLVQAGTFKISVNGTVVCQDTNTFAYNSQGGNCTGSNVVGLRQLRDRRLCDHMGVNRADRSHHRVVDEHDFSGREPVASRQSSARVRLLRQWRPAERTYVLRLLQDAGRRDSSCFRRRRQRRRDFEQPGFQFGAPAYTQAISWLYGTRFPTILPGQSASTPFISANYWRGEGTNYFVPNNVGGQGQSGNLFAQWSHRRRDEIDLPRVDRLRCSDPVCAGFRADVGRRGRRLRHCRGRLRAEPGLWRLHHFARQWGMGREWIELQSLWRWLDHGDRLDAERCLLHRVGAGVLFRPDE